MIKYSISEVHDFSKGTMKKKYVARAQHPEVVSMEDFALYMTQHRMVHDRGTVMAVLSNAADCLKELLSEGKRVDLGDLGSFMVKLESEAVENKSDFTDANIKAVKPEWKPSKRLKDLDPASGFRLEAPVKVKQATLRDERRGGK